MGLRATWPLPAAAVLMLVGVFYLSGGAAIAQAIGIILILAGIGLLAWGFTPRRVG
jgi:multidrug transporter EmrE-like cation transporter